MKKNMGSTDRLIRLAIALILFAFAYWNHSWIALIFGIFVFAEALFSWCIWYQLTGRNTCSKK